MQQAQHAFVGLRACIFLRRIVKAEHSVHMVAGITQVDEDGSNEIDFQEFVHAIQINKAMSEKTSDESETLDAFIALGGNVSLLTTFLFADVCSSICGNQ